MIKTINIFAVLIVMLIALPSVAQKRKKRNKEHDIKAQAIDDVHAMTKDNFPYIEKFHEAVRLHFSGNTTKAKQLFLSCLEDKPNDDAVIFALAKIAEKEKQNTKALELYKRANKIDKNNIHYISKVATLSFDAAQFEESAIYFKQLVKREPRNAEYYYAFAQSLVYTKKYEEAIAALSTVETLLGPVPEISFYKIDLLSASKQEDKIEKEFKKLREAYPGDKDVLNSIVSYYEVKGRSQELIDLMKTEIQTEPLNVSAHLILIEHFITVEDKAAFNNSFNTILNSSDIALDEKVTLIELAGYHNMIDAKSLLAAIETLNSTSPNDKRVQMLLGKQQLQSGELVKGVNNYRTAIVGSTDFKDWSLLLQQELKYGFYKALKEDAEQALEIYPSSPVIYAYNALGNIHQGNLYEASAQLEVGEEYIVKDEHGNLKAFFNMVYGTLAFAKKDYKTADERFQKAVNTAQRKAAFIVEWAHQMALANIGISTADRRLANIKGEFTKDVSYQLAKARVAFRKEEYNTAEKTLKAILQELPNFGNALDLMGDVQFKIGNKEKAVLLWKTAKLNNTSNKIVDKKIETKNINEPKYY